MFDQRVDEIGNRVAPRHHRRLMPSCCAASAVTGPIEATTVSAADPPPVRRRRSSTKLRTAEALANVTASISPIEQHPVDVVFAVPLGSAGHRPVRDDLDDLGARVAQFLGQMISRAMSARGSRTRCPSRLPDALQRIGQRFGAELGRRQVDANAVPLQPRRRGRSDRAQPDAVEIAHVAVRQEPRMK